MVGSTREFGSSGIEEADMREFGKTVAKKEAGVAREFSTTVVEEVGITELGKTVSERACIIR